MYKSETNLLIGSFPSLLYFQSIPIPFYNLNESRVMSLVFSQSARVSVGGSGVSIASFTDGHQCISLAPFSSGRKPRTKKKIALSLAFVPCWSKRIPHSMPSIREEQDDFQEDAEMVEEDRNEVPSMAQEVVIKLQEAATWYSETIHPYVKSVKEPIGYVMWCLLTVGIIAGLPTAKAVFSDPYTELSMILQEQEAEKERQKSRPGRL